MVGHARFAANKLATYGTTFAGNEMSLEGQDAMAARGSQLARAKPA